MSSLFGLDLDLHSILQCLAYPLGAATAPGTPHLRQRLLQALFARSISVAVAAVTAALRHQTRLPLLLVAAAAATAP